MSRTIAGSIGFLLLTVLNQPASSESVRDLTSLIARSFAGTYSFNYLFSEDGALYVDVAAHDQLLELDAIDGAPRITFFNQTGKGEKRAHYSYVFRHADGKVTLREFDGAGKFRFDCSGIFDPEKKTFDCKAPGAPKPARDTDSPITRKNGLFKRPTSWPAYDTLDRHNLFRFYDWGFVNIQQNVKLDSGGRIVAREAGVVTAVKVKAPGDASD
jgi:hypothetical protein